MISAGAARRARLPDRRLVEIRRVAHRGAFGERRFLVSIGYAADAPYAPREIFLDGGFRSGAALEALLKDSAIAISLLLQHGAEPEVILERLGAGAPGGSMIAAMAAELAVAPL
ncbi:MAG: hypothetical protein DI556_13120 [Rhodovulum sulfidophilum]|uniref:ribonucleoside-diphosphate reductase n=1 Tax=Rhodovulum sulfidophilum TaxID=35806 RepID=A0A2W5Q1Y9_RHOSU|nr:MAG: hypothetical protein DI556_13120 [Rhodovulum sulfidophilum]